MNSESVDLIYLDPPFNSNVNYAAPIGSKAAGAEFKDTWTLTDIDIAWLDLLVAKYPHLNQVIQAALVESDKAYLIYMAVRLLEMKRILKLTGSIYLHCDPTMSHYLKLVMDSIFGRRNFRNEIIWGYEKPRGAKKVFKRNHDTILFYSKSGKWTFNPQRVPKLDGTFEMRKPFKRPDGTIWYPKEPGKVAGSWWYDIPSFATRMSSKERTGFKTQKPIALMDRIINASSNKGDIVFDPFCGCATTLVAAEKQIREWVGIDISHVAVQLVKKRIKELQGAFFEKIIHRTDIPQRTDLGIIPKYNSLANKTKLYGEQGGHCNGCIDHFEYRHLEVDHIISKKEGGTDHISNLQLLCGHCNRIKGDRGMEYLKAKFQF